MISDKNKKLAKWAMEYALSNGCQEAKVNLYSGSESSFDIRNTKIDRLKQASENELRIYLFVDGRYGSYTTNRLDKKELKSFIKNAISSTRYLTEDKFRMLVEPGRYYKGGLPDLQLLDTQANSIHPDKKIEIALNAAAEVFNTDKRIVSVASTFNDGESFNYMITSNGFENEKASSWFSLSADVSLKGEGEARPSDGWYESSLYFDDLIKTGVGKKAFERALRKLGQKKIASGKYTMVVEYLVAARLLSPLIQALYGSALQQKNSFLLNHLNTKVGSEKLTLIDEPHLVKSFGASYYDSEGVATSRRTVFEQGILKTYYIDGYSARKMGVKPTIASTSILNMKLGNKDLADLIRGVKKGILVTGFNGGNCNSSTGDFSYGVEGFQIQNGKLTQPISEMNITGNMIDLWNSLVEVGNDPRISSSWRIPSLVFNNIDFSGL